MASEPSDMADRRRYGQALKALRKRAEMTQEVAAERAGVTLQAWQNYEGGKRHWNPRLIRTTTEAVNASEEDLYQQLARIPEPAPSQSQRQGVSEAARAFSLPVDGIVHAGALRQGAYDASGEAEIIDFSAFFGPEWRVLRLAGDSMVPYAEPGGFVTYSKRRPPRRGQGCVIVTTDHDYLVKRFERMTADKLIVTQLHPELETLEFDMSDIEGVYAIGLRGD